MSVHVRDAHTAPAQLCTCLEILIVECILMQPQLSIRHTLIQQSGEQYPVQYTAKVMKKEIKTES